MRNTVILAIILLLALPFAAAYGVTFYNPAWNPQDGKIFDVVEPDTPYVFDVKNPDISITKITFTITREAKNGGVTVYNLRTTPDFIPEISKNDSYEFNELKYSGFVPHDTGKFIYEFKVAKGWLENMSVSRNTVALHAYNRVLEIWETLHTQIIGDDSSFVYYKAEQDKGVHYLFIGQAQSGEAAEAIIEPEELVPEEEKIEGEAEEQAEEGAEEQAMEVVELPSEITPVQLEKAPTPQPPAEPTPSLAPSPAAGPVSEQKGSKISAVIVLIAIAIVVFVVYLVFGKKKISHYSVDKELHNYIIESLKRGKSKEDIRKRLLEVGWHYVRVDKALAKHKEAKPAEKHAEHTEAEEKIKRPAKGPKKQIKAKKK